MPDPHFLPPDRVFSTLISCGHIMVVFLGSYKQSLYQMGSAKLTYGYVSKIWHPGILGTGILKGFSCM